MVVNLSYSFIPLQKILQKGVDRPVENPRKSAVVTKTKTITKTKTPLRKRRPPYENEDHHEKEDPLRKRRPITKTKTHHENDNTLLKQVQKRLVLPLWTKIMFMRHITKTKIPTEILNSEFGTSVIYYGVFQQ